MNTSIRFAALAGLALTVSMVTSVSNASTCYIVNNDPMSISGHATPTLELSSPAVFGDHRFVSLGNDAQIEVAIMSDSGAQVIYEAVDARQPVRVTSVRVGNVERQATVTIGRALPLNYACRL